MRNRLLAVLARLVLRGPWLVVGAWLVLLGAAVTVVGKVPSILEGGSGDLPGTRSARVAAEIARDFDSPFRQVVVATLAAKRDLEPADLAAVRAKLLACEAVRRVLGPDDPGGGMLRGTDGRHAAFLVGLAATSSREAEKAVPVVRAAMAEFRQVPGAGETPALRGASGTRTHPGGIAVAVTGKAPMMVDINTLSEQDTGIAEARVLPLTLLILLVAFGSLVAAGLPLALGLVTTTVTMGLVYVVGQAIGLSMLVQSVVTMVGLGVGIDYSLVLVKRFREALAAGREVPDAVEEAVVFGGGAILWSAVTVLIGFGSLLATPLLETRSLGLGGVLVVLVSLAAGLTLLPALLALLGRRVDAGAWIVRPGLRAATARLWERWAHAVMARPVRSLVAGTALLVALGLPALQMKQSFPQGRWLPLEMEAARGFLVVEKLGRGQVHAPMEIVVRADSGPILARRHLPALWELQRRLAAHPYASQVRSPMQPVPGMTLAQAQMLYADVDAALARFPAIGEFFLSRDRTAAMFTVILRDEVALGQMQAFTREVEDWSAGQGLTLATSGWGAYYNDFDAQMKWTFPRVVGFVVLATFLILAWAFRSILVPLKAVVMNLLSVGAGYGAVVLIFQEGHGAWLFGLQQGLGSVPAVVSILLFCTLFGLSMDYEVFLLTRIREAVDEGLSNTAAVARGLATTGGMITGAALIMTIVFGAFGWARVAIVQMLGVGLAVAVLVDATVVRALLVPAFMRIAGDWNWYPGARPAGLPAAAPGS
ncbi:MAG: MMPL family transporter [Candidatus Sericytochromatia bacterium]|nr:MMPL family transporter [Candidatus Tanganyikabacteria bacterium]